MKLNLSEEFVGIQGEGPYAGKVTYFVRTFGCNLHCAYCDTKYASDGMNYYAQTDEIASRVVKTAVEHVCITGGEPLLQFESVVALIERLQFVGRLSSISIETNGEVYINPQIRNLHYVTLTMDIKTPGSKNENIHVWKDNIKELRKQDVIKFVICDMDDFNFASRIIDKLLVPQQVYISVVWGADALLKQVATIMISNNTLKYCNLQIQMHKVIWGPKKRGV